MEKRRAKTLVLIFIIRSLIPLLLEEVVGKGTIGKAGGMDVAENKAEVPKVTVMVVAMVTAGDTTNKKMTNKIKLCI